MIDVLSLDFRDFKQVRRARKDRGWPFVIGHRGASASAPENTMAAFELAVQQGAHIIESDLWFTRDNEIALHHDRTLQRTMGRPETVGQLTQPELMRCTSLRPNPTNLGSTTIPSLEHLLEMANRRRLGLLLELKDPLFSLPGYGEVLLGKLKEHDLLSSCFLISFAPVCLEAMRALDPHMPLGLVSLKMGLPSGSWSLSGPMYINLLINPLYPAIAHSQGTLVTPLDPSPHLRVSLYRRIGVDAILADDVAQIVSLMENGS